MSDDRRPTPPATERSAASASGAAPLAEARFIPQRYEPNYAYPLLVLLHGRGGDEQQLLRSMPALSWRNYVGLGLRGPEPIEREGRVAGYSWGPAFARGDRGRRPRRPAADDAEAFRRLLAGEPDPIDALEEAVFEAVRQTRRALHVHSERIFLVGCGEGAAVAYRLGLCYPERFAGIVALNGWIPGGFRPLGRLSACRDLRVLVTHGEWNGRAPIAQARRDVAALRAGGLRVAFHAYPCAHRLTAPMLSDVDTWIIHQCTSSR
ncbi:MAG TPA: esterase [Isosphaeraceae bacterium]|jgi:phospholipase/carboxylesterase|nr:esterase [Isosphaeraceae bacterium]